MKKFIHDWLSFKEEKDYKSVRLVEFQLRLKFSDFVEILKFLDSFD